VHLVHVIGDGDVRVARRAIDARTTKIERHATAGRELADGDATTKAKLEAAVLGYATRREALAAALARHEQRRTLQPQHPSVGGDSVSSSPQVRRPY